MTESPVRHEITDRALRVTIDNPPVNVIGQAVRAGLLAACDAAETALAAGRIDRVVLTGAGRAFVAGADAREFDGPALEPHLPEVLDRLARLPAVAAVNGAALGGGFELALACRARIAGPKALVGLPEVTLGVVPGAGGTQRLPRLVGLDTAIPLIAQGRTVKAAEARELGLVDALADDPVAAALALGSELLDRPALDDWPAPAPAPDAAAAARRHAETRQRGQIAPLTAIELMEAAAELPLAEGLSRERAAFLELRQGPQARALRHIFFAERGAGAGPELKQLEPQAIDTALVAGGGTMGAAIAYALGQAGIRVTLLEQDAAAAERARANIATFFDGAVSRGKLSQETAEAMRAERFDVRHGDGPLPPVDIAIEAVFEDLDVKRAVFARLDAALPETTILATNTSYLDPDAVSEGVRAPERFLGLHFFAPAHVMKLVEVVRAAHTSPQTLATAFALTRRLGKIAVEAGICDGFIGNRILTRYRQAGDVLLIEGALPWEIDRAVEAFGMAMGPYAVQDLSGLDIAYANRRRKTPKDDPDHRYVPIADRMVEELQRLGRKTDAGWYDYRDGKPTPSPAVETLIEAASAEAGLPRRSFAPDEIARRMMLAIIAEAFEILEEGIARRSADIDLVLVHGYGFPRWRGGPMKLAEEWGLAAVMADLAALAKEDPKSWRVPPLLRSMVEAGDAPAGGAERE
ncbi:3-hydroxyacyl-CoA dehydrogenase NAD-binding domain-containing protein [Psychromarinibacter sp. C21-152]|uniref:3-hydroxyacyl-CoA dehydrogenase NAD-binding domain-containing protein n=1 Tax=Psychromarinibacter sediminicola TaxID=3033385 RepID=A0AAE3NUR5_9RHOB|nr:3-hydroxyacyl-CoA dehydrogenase NAD-binding domain-containing protein [Psychromarinibacter sediminicola]MDF0602456.1 3-hydroxyacyl-CoA dehydrogenase NAD-binding domain-containing protein [Psychromarinibacter sediminicola]